MENLLVRLEVEGMKHTIVRRLGLFAERQQAEIQAAVEKACTPEYIEAAITSAANDAVRQAIQEEISSFFRFGKGRKVIRVAVEKELSDSVDEL